jgi:hypothetical protein
MLFSSMRKPATFPEVHELRLMRRAACNIPNYAGAMVTADEVVDSISSLKTLGMSA